MNATYPDPATIDPTLFDRTVNPRVECWFKTSAVHLTERTLGYLDLLDRHAIGWIERLSDAPGGLLYEDDVQVVTAP